MKNHSILLTIGELANLHQINKRTLHFYDEAGIFSPKLKGENGYRYYTLEQSFELENILSLRKSGMSVHEIKHYLQNPNPEDFMYIASRKIDEIEHELARLNALKFNFIQKQQLLVRCAGIVHSQIEVVELPKRYALLTNLPVSFESKETLVKHSSYFLSHLREARKLCHACNSCGSYLSLDKVKSKNFKYYDGIFSEIQTKKPHLHVRPKGKYIRGFCVGDWNEIPNIYETILNYASKNNIVLSGYAFESGLNEFAIQSEADYITQIEIFCNY